MLYLLQRNCTHRCFRHFTIYIVSLLFSFNVLADDRFSSAISSPTSSAPVLAPETSSNSEPTSTRTEPTMAPKSELPPRTSSPPDEPAAEEVEDSSDVSTGDVLPRQTGSLMNRELPSPPKDLGLSSRKKLDASKVEPNELIVISNNMDQARELAQQLKQYGLRTKSRKNLKHLGFVMSKFLAPSDIDLQQTAVNIRKAYPKMWADVNHRYILLGVNQSADVAKNIIKWPQKFASCGKNLRIGLIDTEVNTSHPALKKQNIVKRSILTNGIKTPKADHGTAIAALLVGNHKSKLFSGLLPSAKLYAASVFRQRDKNNIDTTSEWVVSAIDWLVSQKVHVINMSIGGPRNLLVEATIQRTIKSGIPVIAAVGNGGANAEPVYPAAQPGVIAVTAVDNKLMLYKSANQGNYIDFAAPGVNIWIAKPEGNGQVVSGTSFAAPFVTASVASTVKKYGPKRAYVRLQGTAKDLGIKGKDQKYGWGLIQAEKYCY